MSARSRFLGTLVLLLGAFLVAGSDINGAVLQLPADRSRIYIVGYPNQIARVDGMTGAGWTALGTEGTGTNQFKFPRGIFVDKDGQIYVADLGNGRIVQT